MLNTTDPLFTATLDIKNGVASMPKLFQLLTDWIGVHLDVTVLNVSFRRAAEGRAPRLTLVLESDADWKRACTDAGRMRKSFRAFVTQTLAGLARAEGVALTFELPELEVAAEPFAPILLDEAISRAFKSGKIELLQRLSRYNIFDIRKEGHTTTLIYYTEAGQLDSEDSGETREIREIFADYLKEYDLFGYSSNQCLPLRFDNLERRKQEHLIRRFVKVETAPAQAATRTQTPKTRFDWLNLANGWCRRLSKTAAVF